MDENSLSPKLKSDHEGLFLKKRLEETPPKFLK
jgi:hypothetical protein